VPTSTGGNAGSAVKRARLMVEFETVRDRYAQALEAIKRSS
jgi:hypothetical protein